MKRTVVIILLAHFTLTACFAQQPTIQNPEAASLNKYLDIPIDKSTGVPSINIPAYDIKLNGFNMPISLSYHASGIRVEDEASSVGLGWALNAGGIITRTIKSQPDEMGGYYTSYGTGQPNYPQLAYPPYYPCNGCQLVFGQLPNIVESGIDTEPDLFYFNVNGLSGKFIFDNTRTVRLIPEQDIKIEPIDQNFSGFKLTNSDGAVYLFTAKESSHSTSQTGVQSGNFTSGWRLTEVTTPNLDVIQFNYSQQGYSMQRVVPQSVYLSRNMTCPETTEWVAYNSANQQSIQSIVFPSGKIDFTYKPSFREDFGNCGGGSYGCINLMKALESISVSETTTNIVTKKLILNTSYFTSNSNLPYNAEDYQKKRLRLDEIYECDANNNCLPPYKFFYNKNNSTVNGYLPSKVSLGQDHWGYCNGADYNTTLYSGIANCNGNANRDPNPAYKSAYILDEIKFPTGGIKSLLFESSAIGGGLRIKEIKDDAGNGSMPIVKQYTYDGETLVTGGPVYVQAVESAGDIMSLTGNVPYYYEVCNLYYNNAGVNYNYDYVFQRAVNYTGEITSNYVLFSQVTERTVGNGSIISNFDVAHINDEIDLNEVGKYPFIVESPLLLTGKLISEIVKDEAGNELKSTFYNYYSTRSMIIQSPDAYKVVKPLCVQEIKPYNLYSGAVFLGSKTEFVNSSSGIVEINTNYEYGSSPSHHSVTKETIVNSDGSSLTKRFKYPIDYKSEIGNLNGSEIWDESSRAIHERILRNINAEPVEVIFTKAKGGVEYLVGGQLLRHKVWQNSQNKSQVSLFTNSSMNLPTPLVYIPSMISAVSHIGSSVNFTANASYGVQNTFDKYDDRNNVISWYGVDGIRNVYVWGHNKDYVFAHVIGSDYNVVNNFINQAVLDNPLSSPSLVLTQLNNLRSGLANTSALVSTYEYKPLVGIKSVTDPNSKTAYYQYDNFNRLIVIRDKDQKVIKKICYNYFGQPEDCTSACPPNAPADWQNTNTPPTCQQGLCGNTGYQLQEQRDMNPCSPTYNQTQNVLVYNPAACVAGSGVTITYNNQTTASGYTATYTHTTTGQVYTFSIPANSSGTLGCVPAGIYTLNISTQGISMYMQFGTGCHTVTGTSLTIGKVNVSNCHHVTMTNFID